MSNETPKGKMNISVDDLETVTCSCGSIHWKEALILKKVSAIVSPNGEEGVLPMPDMLCAICNKSITELEEASRILIKK